MRKITLTALVAALGCMANTFAAMPLPMGWYMEGNAGKSNESSANYGTSLSSSTNTGLAWNVNGGYKFMPYLAAELGYTNYTKQRIKFNNAQIAQDVHYSYYLAGKGILPISDSGVELFAKLGIARINSHVTISDPTTVNTNGLSVNAGTHHISAAYFGVGTDYNYTSNMAFNLQWDRAKGNSTTGNLDLYSVGVSYLFG